MALGHTAGKDGAGFELVILGQTHRAESSLGKNPHSRGLGKSFPLSEPFFCHLPNRIRDLSLEVTGLGSGGAEVWT